ncbi:hypothetical protein [Neobacillus citreus]|uniref:Uncharacterized protein n=1 Tax=Neobacillus citreus TaxID=2833578 RepID=A0A942T6W8_9BACI|nr:hypothetical protein [Neobacillus citreus]MCH6269582.1 hypothetical protein [Neobacillus citreus]
MLVKEAYEDSFRFEESTLAHYIYHLLTEQKISLEDDMSILNAVQADNRKVAELIRKNVLGINKVRVYSLKMNKKDFFFIFASSPQEAIQFFTETFQQSPLNCHEYPLEFEFVRGKEVVTFQEMRKDFESFPAVAGRFEKVGGSVGRK